MLQAIALAAALVRAVATAPAETATKPGPARAGRAPRSGGRKEAVLAPA